MKKLSLNPKKLLKVLSAGLLLALYWYWINQKIISDSNEVFGLLGFFLLMCTATAYFPLPANILVLGAVKSFSPLTVAAIAGLATIVAYLSEYFFFTFLFRLKKMANFKDSWLYKKVSPIFDKNPFFILSFSSFLPIPSEPIRIYAISRKYKMLLFLGAGFAGRLPRYFLLGFFGKEYVNSVPFLIGVIVFPAIFLLLIRGVFSLNSWVRTRISETQLEPSALPATISTGASTDSEITSSGD